MAGILNILSNFVNNLHDIILYISKVIGLNLSDKDLHFWLIGALGIFIFFVTDVIFKRIAMFNVSVISFIYTFTVLLVIVFGLEIEQKITHRGNMEFADIVAGLWGFLCMFSIYLIIQIAISLIKKAINKM
ncbi:small membrane protein [Desulfofarcimen acetoxidans DSM 771]|jgi:hypothetical protein|uniref:Small membrane protein n=1 Tax=Desulfofarcimen acetoxidans (strain ATCC 49208 / DSM 771 / KCTC 5769 / VKM B-1644 / 5575) TaxID=485916 RepID=C8VVX3_DESAS|nr:hypothetical protein [Desulfofarcimen acetoxidans]ACV64260.1 small membrane protein [Desulfofarcimen acetoxidans DSM 771]